MRDPVQILTLLALLLLAVTTAAADDPPGAVDLDRLAACAHVESPPDRLHCYDELVDELTRKVWEVGSEPSGIPGKPDVALSLEADREIRGSLTRAVPRLILECRKGQVQAFVRTGVVAQLAGSRKHTATLRLDRGDATREVLTASINDDLHFKDPVDVIRRLINHDSLLFMFTPFSSSPVKSTFDIRGLDEALPPLATACDLLLAPVPRSPDDSEPTGPLIAGVDGVTHPRRIEASYARPDYPERARTRMTEGRVILQAVILKDGSVSNLEVLDCRPEGVGFEASAMRAVSQWRYEPALKDGVPVDVYFTVKLDFALGR